MTLRPEDLARLAEVARRQEGLVTAAQCDERGVSMDVRARLCRKGQWRRLVRGVYDTEPRAKRSWARRRRKAALVGLLRYGPDAVAVGASALALLGVDGLPADLVSEVTLGTAQRRDPPVGAGSGGTCVVAVRQYDLSGGVWRVGGFRVAEPRTALAQAVTGLPRRNAIAVMDSMLHKTLIDADGLTVAKEIARGRRGAAKARGWWDLADGRAESTLETFGRLDCVDAGIPPDELQVVLTAANGDFVARGDMGWRIQNRRWLIAEFDGREHHEDTRALFHDRERQNDMHVRAGAELLRFTYVDTETPGRVAAVVARALKRWR